MRWRWGGGGGEVKRHLQLYPSDIDIVRINTPREWVSSRVPTQIWLYCCMQSNLPIPTEMDGQGMACCEIALIETQVPGTGPRPGLWCNVCGGS